MIVPCAPDERTNTNALTKHRNMHENLTNAKIHRLTEVFAKVVVQDTLPIFTDVQPTDFSWSLSPIVLRANETANNLDLLGSLN
jgi:hypothetical protein